MGYIVCLLGRCVWMQTTAWRSECSHTIIPRTDVLHVGDNRLAVMEAGLNHAVDPSNVIITSYFA